MSKNISSSDLNLRRIAPGLYETEDGDWQIERGDNSTSFRGLWMVWPVKARRQPGTPVASFADAKRELAAIDHTHSKQPHWKVYTGKTLLADGHATMSGAVDSAERSIKSRGLDQTDSALAVVASQKLDRKSDDDQRNRASKIRTSSARRRSLGKRIL